MNNDINNTTDIKNSTQETLNDTTASEATSNDTASKEATFNNTTSNDTSLPETNSPINQPTESMDDYKAELDASLKKVREGDILTGTVIAISDTNVTLDLKYYTEGIISVEHLSNDPNFNIHEDIHVGDEITATVLRRDDGEGHIVLSKKEANDILAWEKLKEYLDNKTILSIKIGGIVNKGVIAYVEGIRGFIPASKLDVAFVEDTQTWLNKVVEAIVITVDKDAKKLVLSAKEPAMEKLSTENSKKASKVVVGSVMNGTIETLKDYGAFIKLENGLSGLLHVSEISDKRLKSPYGVLKDGQAVTVKIIKSDNGKLSLSMKGLSDNIESSDLSDYDLPESAPIGTGLGALLKNIKLK